MTKPKNFAQCYLYGLTNAEGDVVEKNLFEFLMTAQRINIRDQSFKPIVTQLKSRTNNAIVLRMLQQGNVVLGLAKKEVPASFKVIAAKDPKDGRKEKIFVDVTGLINYENGFFVCKEIDRFAAYMLGVLVYQIYTKDPNKLTRNGSIQKYSVSAFMKMFSSELDYLRLTGFMSNRAKITYIAGVYFGVAVMGLDMGAARRTAAAVSSTLLGFNAQECRAADYYYDAEDFTNINTFIESISKTFKLEGLTTDIFVDRWIYLYGKGSHFAVELYPVFLNTIIYAYSGTYMNNMKRIEFVLGRDLVDLTTAVLKVGNDMFSAGFTYESGVKDYYKFQEGNISDNTRQNLERLGAKVNGDDSIEYKGKHYNHGEDKEYTMDELEEDATSDKMKENLEKMKAAQAKMDAANKKAGDALDSVNAKFGIKREADELDPEEIHKDAIEAEPDNDGEIKSLIDELEADSVLEADELDAKYISKEGLKSEEEDQGVETPEEMDELIKQLEDDTPLE